MDDKASRREKSEEQDPRRKQVRSYRQKVWKFLQTNKNTLFTSFMLLMVVVLLFGIFSQLKPPTVNTTPSDETTISYSSFVQQVDAGNVLAVAMQGNDLHGLLAAPFSANTSSSSHARHVTLTSKAIASDYALWSHYLVNGDSSWVGEGATPTIDPARAVYTQAPVDGEASLMPRLLADHVKVSTIAPQQTSVVMTLLWRLAPIILAALFLLIFLVSRNSTRSTRSLDDRITQIGRSRARRFVRTKEANHAHTRETSTLPPQMRRSPTIVRSGQTPGKPGAPRVNTDPPVTFADVAGVDEVRAELEEIVQFLRTPERFSRLGARIPRGALLVGPPGTGKTLLARAVAGEANVPFFSMSASEFVEMFVGVGASRVRDLFNQARQAAPCVVFIDELDAVGRKRSMRIAGNDERDQTLNQLLVELDGFDPRKAVVVMAATNRVDILDNALLRPGRFDRRITVSPPDRVGREAILKIHTRRCPLHEDVSLERLARMTTGMTGADLANLVNEAALSAARRDLERITDECFEEALARVQLGALRPLVMDDRERRIIAVHEGGHALVAYHLPYADTVNRVTILPRGQSLGVTQFIAEEDRYNYSREMLMTRIAVGLGGRVAEELTFGTDQVTTGAENDLQVVTNLARRMVTRWGMSERVGVVFADSQDDGAYSLNMRRSAPDDLPAQHRSLVMDADGRLLPNGELSPSRLQRQELALSASVPRSAGGVMMNALIDAEVQRILNEGHAMARAVLTEHNDQLMLLADTLLEHEQLDRARFEALLQGEKQA
jgi:ATP-dependent metalloprotease FtsH